jgi:hypothetical protein
LRGEIVHSFRAPRYTLRGKERSLSTMIVLLALIVFALLMGLFAAAVWVWRSER